MTPISSPLLPFFSICISFQTCLWRSDIWCSRYYLTNQTTHVSYVLLLFSYMYMSPNFLVKMWYVLLLIFCYINPDIIKYHIFYVSRYIGGDNNCNNYLCHFLHQWISCLWLHLHGSWDMFCMFFLSFSPPNTSQTRRPFLLLGKASFFASW